VRTFLTPFLRARARGAPVPRLLRFSTVAQQEADHRAAESLTPHQPAAESLRLELQEAITTFRHQIALLIQALSVLVTADSALLAYGFSQKQSGVFLVASLMPIAALSVFIAIMYGLIPIAYAGMRIEEQLSLHQAPLIIGWVKVRKDLPFAAFKNVDDWSSPEIERAISRTSPSYLLRSYKSHLLLIAFLVQLSLCIISKTIFHYRFM
jgi:hypothetical protein